MGEKIEKYYIIGDNIYNWDRKGFIIGLIYCIKYIISVEALKSGKITHINQDGNKEFFFYLYLC